MPAVKLIDPLYNSQWHLKALGGNIERIWSEYDGSGVHTAIYDTGIDKNHEDLKGGYDASLELIINGTQADPSLGIAAHGTAVAGLIVGQANGVGGVGVSYGSTLTAVNIFGGVAGKNMIEAVKQMAKFDTVNNSWNWGAVKYADNASQENSFGDQFVSALAGAAETGRGTLGTIIVNSAGNDWASNHIDTNTAEFSQSRHTITVGALGQDGNVASYSNRGASLLVSAPSSEGKIGLTTTDATGVSGYEKGSYTATFGGTSAAAPVVTGVVNLMLDANQGLGWRDVQSILAITAEHTGIASLKGEAAGRMAFGWTINAADNVNGGGLHYSNDVGFGRVDAFEAVRFAEVWSQFSASQTSANEAHVTAQDKAALKIDGSVQFSFHVSDAIALEHADLTLTLTHPNVADLRIELVSPEGTTTILQDTGGAAFAATNWTWTFGSEALRGEVSKGDWTVRIVDTNGGAAGELKSFSFDGYGSAATTGDVYHLTSDFAKALAWDSGRGLLKDVDGGVDWINASGLTTNGVVDLRAGAKSDLGLGATFSVGASVIENAVTGDGHDTIYGNGGANQLMGMRGNDVLLGLAGDDTLMGGDGADTLVGGFGDDPLIGGGGSDLFVFGAPDFGNDIIKDFEIGGDKIDFRGSGLSFSDIEITWAGTALVLSLFSQKGTISFMNLTGQLSLSDFFFGQAANGGSLDQRDPDSTGTDEGAPVLGQPVEHPPAPPEGGGTEGTGTEPGVPSNGDVATGPGRQSVKNTVSARDFTLANGDLNLSLTGSAIKGEGNDLGNKIVGTEGNNVLIGNAGDDSLYGGGGADTLRGGTSNDKLYGQDGNDILEGEANADTLDGGTGGDVMRGGAGADKYVVEDSGDVVD
ncbi:S8 family serine peptidase, partial [Methylobacterium sp. Leaf91]|uniref:S8 family serine peptidase n=1 Tax=Methylobacterium sp. Leaf91 TaxID=1736247 RepID=UPI0006FA39C3